MKSSDLFLMYGTSEYYITKDAKIFGKRENAFVIDPWQTDIPSDKPITFSDEKFSTTLTLSQFMTYTFYGYATADVGLKYPKDIPTVDNCQYIDRVEFVDSDDFFAGVKCGGELYKYCKSDGRRNRLFFINATGAIIECQFLYGWPHFNHVQWNYINSYPYGDAMGASTAIHLLVWDAWVCKDRLNMHIHHKDECRWHVSVDNLEALTDKEHRHLHNALRDDKNPESRKVLVYTDAQLHHVCEMLESDCHINDIIEYLTNGNHDRANAAHCTVRRLLSGKAARITEGYDFSKYRKNKGIVYNPAVVHRACKMLINPYTKYSDLDISTATGIGSTMIGKIRRGETISNASIADIVEIYKDKISPDVRKSGRYMAKLNESQVKEIVSLCIRTNMSNDEIAMRYLVTAEIVRQIRKGTHSSYAKYLHGEVPCVFTDYDRRYRKSVIILDESDINVQQLLQEYYSR